MGQAYYRYDIDSFNKQLDLEVFWGIASSADGFQGFDFEYGKSDGTVIDRQSGLTSEFGSLIFPEPLDTKPGVAQTYFSFSVYDNDEPNDSAGTGATIFDGALETKDLTITAGAGSQLILGGSGDDTLRGGAGGDLLDGGAGIDTVVYSDSSAGVTIVLGEPNEPTSGAGGYAEGDRLVGFENVIGSNKVDDLTGNKGANRLDGRAGADVMKGGEGDDTYLVDDASDTISEAVGGGADGVLSSISYTLAVGQEIERLATTKDHGTDGLKLTGNERSQTITGNSGANTLDGKAGNDTLAGGLGNDVMTGGSGKDAFLFDSRPDPHNIDHIKDFRPVDDTIRLEKSIFDKIAGNGTLSVAQFKDITDPATVIDGDDRLLYNHDSGRLYYDADGSGSKAKVQIAILDNSPLLTNGDVLLV